MNFKQFGSLLPDNPLCGISTYKDELNLATGDCTKYVKKLVLTGEENWYKNDTASTDNTTYVYTTAITSSIDNYGGFCSHFVYDSGSYNHDYEGFSILTGYGSLRIRVDNNLATTATAFKTWLQQQYTNGTPVVVYYALATAETETITVPSGLSGTEEGYLNQSGTPTPTNPIYPTANTVEKWFDINHYIMGTDTDTLTTLPADIYANDSNATVGLKGDMEQSGTPSPTTPIQPQECGDLETTGEHTGQYKIPILSNSTTTPVYLGEVQSTRQIKKYEFTGQETVYEYDANNGIYRFRLSELSIERLSNTDIIVSHFSKAISTAEIQDGQYSIGTNYIYLRITNITSGSDFATYLQQQYSAETPVCIWYVLANPTTGIVNKPLRKIGDYADEVLGITIPTTAGANTLSVDTTLQPSELNVNYKGWHPVQSVHERTNGAWD